jgi:p-aminobenzoyl-glutamate transporter AbgT
VVPAIVLVLLGPLFMVFSFNVTRSSLSEAVARYWPFCFASLIVVLIALFLCRKQVAPVVAAVTDVDDESAAGTDSGSLADD